MKRITMGILALVLVLSMVLAGCSSNTATEPAKDEKQSEQPATASKNEITIGVVGDPHNWDPIDTFLLDWSTIATSVFEGLVDRTVDLKIQPGLAESWQFLDDQTLQFKLRQGVQFHNGEPFNAEAVKFTFDRLLGEEGKKGPQQANYTSIDHVEIVDEYTVNFILKTKDPVLLTKLAGYGGVIVPPKYIQEKGDEYFNEHPVGTGPFKMTTYEKDNKVVLEKNENYWKEGLPKLDKVTFRIIPEATTRLAELQTGAIDVMKAVAISQAATVEKEEKVDLVPVGAPTVYSIRFDTSKPPVDNPKVREAIALAIDADTIIETVLNGYGKRISTFQSEMSFGNDPSLPFREFNPEKAKQLLKEAGVKEGTALDFYFPGNDAIFKEVAQAVQIYLKDVGIQVNINPVDSSTFISDLIPNGKAGHMYRQGWGGWTLDFDNTAYLLYHKGEFWNPDFYDEKVEQYLAEERSTFDEAKRLEAFKKLDARLYELVPDVPLYQSVNLWAVSKKVKGFTPPADERIRLEEVTVE
ncbi:ABC transporter substrate-binding protein [Tepidibacillus infernus]|uniref:Peptide ABC transporter substrate-binding protein n=1 Tax=Tepidibacillus decaturensis TaxID=1413211 RepID=A0A135L6K6_9BACI|nr:ABC transporter substrate-binding protein [Tepidibacillus decaturensis]KXG44606.1 peptide ABC transporter substrate-binding protein [Tepidibacillus decaturensis]